MNIGVRVTYKHKVFETQTDGFETTRSVTPDVLREDRPHQIQETVYACVGLDSQDVAYIIQRHADKSGAIEWKVSKEFQTQHPVGLKKMDDTFKELK